MNHLLGNFGLDLMLALAATMGGAVRIVHELLCGTKFEWLVALGRIVVSLFSGWCCAKAGLGIGLNMDLTIAIASVTGWLGSESLSAVVDFFKRKMSQ